MISISVTNINAKHGHGSIFKYKRTVSTINAINPMLNRTEYNTSVHLGLLISNSAILISLFLF